MKIFVFWLSLITLSSLPAYSEIMVGYSAEWISHKSRLIAIATPVQIEVVQGVDIKKLAKIQYRLDEVIKGPQSTGDTVTIYNYRATETTLGKHVPKNTEQVLIFCTEAKHLYREIEGKYVFTETDHFISAYEMSQPVRKLFTPDFSLLTSFPELLQRTKAQVAYESDLERNYWKGVIIVKRLEVPMSSSAYQSLYSGSSCYIIVPDYQQQKEAAITE